MASEDDDSAYWKTPHELALWLAIGSLRAQLLAVVGRRVSFVDDPAQQVQGQTRQQLWEQIDGEARRAEDVLMQLNRRISQRPDRAGPPAEILEWLVRPGLEEAVRVVEEYLRAEGASQRTAQDAKRRRLARAALDSSLERLRSTLSLVADPAFTWDRPGVEALARRASQQGKKTIADRARFVVSEATNLRPDAARSRREADGS